MRVLELFKGTGSIGKYINKAHPEWEVISLDILSKYNPTICIDIIDWDYKVYEPGYFDIIWASPECKVYCNLQGSLLKQKWGNNEEDQKANLEKARRNNDKYVLRALEIIEYFKPSKWFIENPWNSNMKTIPELNQLPSYRFDYCRFGFPYQKPTRIWSNKILENMKCNCKKGHEYQLCMSNHFKDRKNHRPDKSKSIRDRYRIPEPLIEYLIN